MVPLQTFTDSGKQKEAKVFAHYLPTSYLETPALGPWYFLSSDIIAAVTCLKHSQGSQHTTHFFVLQLGRRKKDGFPPSSLFQLIIIPPLSFKSLLTLRLSRPRLNDTNKTARRSKPSTAPPGKTTMCRSHRSVSLRLHQALHWSVSRLVILGNESWETSGTPNKLVIVWPLSAWIALLLWMW